MTAKDYPITTPFGKVDGYPLNNGFHKGLDYGCPVGTPVVVSGVQIGLSGDSGFVTGPHLHIGKWVDSQPQDPTGGFDVIGTVTEVGYDETNGNYVRIGTGSASWVYLHLSKIGVSVGQGINGEIMDKEATYEFAANASQFVLLRKVPMGREEFDKYHKGSTESQIYERFATSQEASDNRFKCWDYDKLAQQNAELAEAVKNQPTFATNITEESLTESISNTQKLLDWLGKLKRK